jgi:hypothetical protein
LFSLLNALAGHLLFSSKKKLCSVLHELNPFLFEQPLVD